MLGTLAHALLRAASTILSMHGSRRTKKYPHECGYGTLRNVHYIHYPLLRGRRIVEPQKRPRYTPDELLAECNPKAARAKEDREWAGNGPAGAEIL